MQSGKREGRKTDNREERERNRDTGRKMRDSQEERRGRPS